MRRSRTARWAAAVVTAAGLTGTTVLAQPPAADPDAARQRQVIADGKAEAMAREAVREAERLAKTNKARAAQVLRAAQAEVESVVVGAETRKSLKTLLAAKLAALDGKPAPEVPEPKADLLADPAKVDKQAVLAAVRAEVKEVPAALAHVQRLRDLGQKAEADKAAAALAAKYPNNPAVIFLGRRDEFGRAAAEARELAQLQSDAWVQNANSVARSGIAAGNDIEFPKDWKEKTARRLKKVELTEKEKSLLAALDKPVTLSLTDQPLRYALTELATAMDQQLIIDQKSLANLGTDLDAKKVTVDARGLSARTVLRQVLGAEGLTFLVKDQLIQVMSVESARDQLATKVYYLGDIAQGVGPFAGPFTWGPAIDLEQTLSNVKVITEAIRTSVDPEVWKGGYASMTFHLPSMSLIVRAPSEVHASLGSKLGAGR